MWAPSPCQRWSHLLWRKVSLQQAFPIQTPWNGCKCQWGLLPSLMIEEGQRPPLVGQRPRQVSYPAPMTGLMSCQMWQSVSPSSFPELIFSQKLLQLMLIHVRIPSLIQQIAVLPWWAVSPTAKLSKRARKRLVGTLRSVWKCSWKALSAVLRALGLPEGCGTSAIQLGSFLCCHLSGWMGPIPAAVPCKLESWDVFFFLQEVLLGHGTIWACSAEC